MTVPDPLYRLQEAAQRLGMPADGVANAINTGFLKTTKVAGKTHVRESALLEFRNIMTAMKGTSK